MSDWFVEEERMVNCPFCGSSKTTLFSLFGQQLLTVQYYCETCHTPFEYIKDDTLPGTQQEAFPAPSALSPEVSPRKETSL